jgi:hypothetical protein
MSHRSDVPSQFHLLMFFSTSNDGEALTLTDHQLAPQISSSGLPVTCVPVTSYTDFAAVFPSCYSHLSLEVQKHEQIGRPGTSQPLCQCRPASWAPFSPNCPSPPQDQYRGPAPPWVGELPSFFIGSRAFSSAALFFFKESVLANSA